MEEFFVNRDEALRYYDILKGILKKLPKKGLVISPCIFPWHQVSLGPSGIAARLCLIAWMLKDDVVLDEAAGFIPIIGQGEGYNYYNMSRAAAARLLLYRPKSAARKKVLFELLHNAEEYTNEEAYRLAEDMELTLRVLLEDELSEFYYKNVDGRGERQLL